MNQQTPAVWYVRNGASNDAPDCPLVSTCTGLQMHVSLFTSSPTHLNEHARTQLRKTRTLTSVWQQGDISQISIQ